MKEVLNNPETKARQQAASTGRMQSTETRLKKALTLTGHAVTPEAREKMRLANLGRRHSIETRMKMSESRKGHIVTAETGRKISEAKRRNFMLRGEHRNG
jgi:hypothetical protein